MEYLSPDVHYLNASVITLLNDINVFSVIDFLNCDNKLIEKSTSLTLKEIFEIKKQLLKKYAIPRSAYACYKRILAEIAIIPVGIPRLDNLLDGGLFTGNIYEICGLPASGKTVFCLTLLKNIATLQQNEIFYLDTKFDFLGTKLKHMLCSLNKEELMAVMNRILVHKINSKQCFLKTLLTIKQELKQGKNVKLIIIDSLPPLCFISSNPTENNAFLTYTANILQHIAKEYNVVIVVTNLMTLWNDGDFKNTDVMKEKIACGTFWYGVPNVRITLKKEENTCKMTICKTMKFMPESNSCDVHFTDEGFV